MPVYNGNSKAKDLYYGGTKIKEAYYGSTKVYSSGPLYYCYRGWLYDTYWYYYALEKPTTSGSVTFYTKRENYYLVQASNSSELNNPVTTSIKNVTENQFTFDEAYLNFTCNYYPSGDLYT